MRQQQLLQQQQAAQAAQAAEQARQAAERNRIAQLNSNTATMIAAYSALSAMASDWERQRNQQQAAKEAIWRAELAASELKARQELEEGRLKLAKALANPKNNPWGY